MFRGASEKALRNIQHGMLLRAEALIHLIVLIASLGPPWAVPQLQNHGEPYDAEAHHTKSKNLNLLIETIVRFPI